MFIDTHTHLYEEQLQQDPQHIQRAIDAGIHKMYMPNCDSSTIEPMMAIAAAYPQHCIPTIGLHPCYVKENVQQELATMQQWLSQHKFAAIGEIGLDYYWDKTFIVQQAEALHIQIDWALAYDLPIIIHCREAMQEAIDLVRSRQNGALKGIFHCFGGTLEEATAIVDMGLYLGIGGVATYKKSGLDKVLPAIGIEHLVLETDAPYLAPVPFRGKRNESAYIPYIAATVGQYLGLSVDEVAKKTTENASKIFPY